MKKFLCIFLCLLFIFPLTSCGENKEELKEIADNYFTYLKENDYENMCLLAGEDKDANLLQDLHEIEEMFDVDTYGQAFIDEAKSYTKMIAENFIDSYEITKVERNKDNKARYLVRVTAQMRDYDSDTALKIYNFDDIVKQSLEFNETELTKVYEEQGEKAFLHTVYEKAGEQYFGLLRSSIKAVKPQKTELTITLEKSDDTWKVVEVY